MEKHKTMEKHEMSNEKEGHANINITDQKGEECGCYFTESKINDIINRQLSNTARLENSFYIMDYYKKMEDNAETSIGNHHERIRYHETCIERLEKYWIMLNIKKCDDLDKPPTLLKEKFKISDGDVYHVRSFKRRKTLGTFKEG